MHQPERKYQLFPKDKQPAAAAGKSLDPEQAFAHAMGQNGEKSDKSSSGSGLRIRIKEHNLIRRRKVSVPELGPMTTVQEVAMDSPTIPGRPPLHERSISAPGHSWKGNHLVEHMIQPKQQTLDEKAELTFGRTATPDSPRKAPEPRSPKSLAPLVIPTQNSPAPRLTRQLSLTRLRSGSTPLEPLRSARTDESRTPYTPMSAALTTPMSAALTTPKSAATNSTLPTPLSAPIEARSSPKPWEKSANHALVGTPKDTISEASTTPRADPEPKSASAVGHGHRRNQSESGSIMERGRPRKRSETSQVTGLKRSASKRANSAERRAFEHLPKGWKATDSVNMLSQDEVSSIRKQAYQQASRFEILRKEDVDNLSRELRQLDERTEYLRRTYTSLRAGRRNLHTRICQYLRSPRTAKFSHESMLKQEEALAELDASIDDWVTKLEQAENRRTRVRQKLLEHVAAAVTLPASPGGNVVGSSESLQLAMGIRSPGNISTPPRSPTKTSYTHTLSSSPSPQRVVAQVPSTILEQPLFEEAAIGLGLGSAKEAGSPRTTLRRAETIRIYADNDVYALFADVENEITKMSGGDIVFSKGSSPILSEGERRQLHRAQSQEVLSGKALLVEKEKKPEAKKPATPPPTTTHTKNDREVFLTNAVFRPETSVLAL
ncbi:hypothetical protein GQ53DRAFT_645423 [Thozetella sp. PMI_491]|nr:hypothetical protein GQ53DRAFT_645423 [Thozetella sp. PMI_491]